MYLSRPPKILILESQMIIAADVSLQLSILGYHVIGINMNAEDALVTIKNNRPDIVLMNIKVHHIEQRIVAAKFILETYRIPVVFLSALSNRELFRKVIHAQPYAFITKPFQPKDLQRGVETAIDRMDAEGLCVKRIKLI